MKTQMFKSAILMSAFFFILTTIASGQLLKPGEIVYGRTQSDTNGSCGTAAIWAVGQDGANDRFVTFGRHPRISADGRKILFKRWASNVSCTSGFDGFFSWFIRDLATGVETLIGSQNGSSTGAFFTPETNRAGLQITASEAGAMCQLNTSGGRTCYQIQIEPIRGFGHPSVRGGDFLIAAENYDSNPNGVGGLYTLGYNRTNIQKIPNTTYIDEGPSWSNDGQTIAYAVYTTQCCRTAPYYFLNLFKIKPDGTNKIQLTNVSVPPGEGFAYGLVWSPDNSIIYNAAKLNNVTGIYKIDANGGGVVGRVPTTPGQPVEWVGGIMPPYEEKEIAAWGGGVGAGANYTLVNTIGQAFAGQTSAAENYNLQSGFWTYDRRKTPFDFDGDGKTDVAVFRPSNGTWYVSNSSNGSLTASTFGNSGDILTPADYDGDGKTDVAVYRGGNWYILRSSNNSFLAVSFGSASDNPQFGDFDGDGRADQAVFRPSNGVWYILRSTQGFVAYAFGISTDKPVAADYDGDGRSDIAVYRDGNWYILGSQSGFIAAAFGNATDKPVIGDYDGDGRSDTAVYRSSVGAWYFLRSSNNSFGSANFGISSDVPAPGDYDGDGKNDFAVFRPSESYWYIWQSSDGTVRAQAWGTNQDVPVPASIIP
jgi:FG-GAP-like repeat/WD40-like Beta Propeller Repeat/FG-GAP repeat